MVVDSSVVLAILLDEEGVGPFKQRLAGAGEKLMSAASVVESGLVLLRRKSGFEIDLLYGLVDRLGVAIEPVSVEQTGIALDAFRRYGKGMGHPARLNYGDCFSYALARAHRLPLLFKGDDFGRTDIRSALADVS